MPGDATDQPDVFRDDILEKVGRRLRDLRKRKGYRNYEEFALKHGINRTQYGRYENGANITLSTLVVILDALETDLAEFFSEGFD